MCALYCLTDLKDLRQRSVLNSRWCSSCQTASVSLSNKQHAKYKRLCNEFSLITQTFYPQICFFPLLTSCHFICSVIPGNIVFLFIDLLIYFFFVLFDFYCYICMFFSVLTPVEFMAMKDTGIRQLGQASFSQRTKRGLVGGMRDKGSCWRESGEAGQAMPVSQPL